MRLLLSISINQQSQLLIANESPASATDTKTMTNAALVLYLHSATPWEKVSYALEIIIQVVENLDDASVWQAIWYSQREWLPSTNGQLANPQSRVDPHANGIPGTLVYQGECSLGAINLAFIPLTIKHRDPFSSSWLHVCIILQDNVLLVSAPEDLCLEKTTRACRHTVMCLRNNQCCLFSFFIFRNFLHLIILDQEEMSWPSTDIGGQ